MSIKDFFVDNAPKLLVGGGVVGLIGSGVYACFQTRKLEKTLDIRRGRMTAIKERTPAPTKKEIFVEKAITCAKVAKLYALPALGAAASTYCVFKGTGLLEDRLEVAQKNAAALSTTLGALAAEYKGYRDDVRERYGEEVESDIYNHTTEKEVTVTTTDENGEKHEETKTVKVFNGKPAGVWYFCPPKTVLPATDLNYSLWTIESTEHQMNVKLSAHGIVYKNDVLIALGMDPEDDGWMIGKIFDRNSLRDDQLKLNYTECWYTEPTSGEIYHCYRIEPNFEYDIIPKAIAAGILKSTRRS